MLRPARDGARALAPNLLGKARVRGGARVAALGQGRQRDVAVLELGGGDELPLARVPRVEDLGRRRAAQDPRVDEPRELDVRDVPRRGVDALEVPDRFRPACWV